MINNFVKTSVKRNNDFNTETKVKGSKHNRKNNRNSKRNWQEKD